MKILASFFFSFLVPLMVFSKHNDWYTGVVVLNTNEVLQGHVNYNAIEDLLQFQKDGLIKVYPASKVNQFYYYDDEAEMSRKFLSKDIFTNDRKSLRMFFEVVIKGEFTILRKHSRFRAFNNNMQQHLDCSMKTNNLEDRQHDYIYYLLYKDEIVEYKDFKKEVLPFIEEVYAEEIKSFIAKNTIKDYSILNQGRILDHFNKTYIQKEKSYLLTSY